MSTPCYHCHQQPHVPGSVFCADCKPSPGSLPALIQEPTESKQSNAPSFLTRLLAPLRHAANVTKRMRSIEDELKDCQQANLALRRKCQDLKAQRDALQETCDKVCMEAIKQHDKQRSLVAMYDDRTREVHSLRAQLADLRAQYQEEGTK